MRKTQRTTTTNSTARRRADTTQMLLAMIVISVGLAFVMGMTIGGSPEERALRLEEEQAVMEWKIASRVTGYAVFGIGAKVALFVIGGYVVFYLSAILRNFLDLRARQVYARDGIFPVIEVQQGVLYDPNRDNAGAHPLITIAALDVQKTAAMKAEKILVRQTDRRMREMEALMPQLEALPASSTLPELIRLADVSPRPTLAELALGMGTNGLITASLHDLMHVLAVGASGFGKSAFLRALIWQLAQAQEPVSIVGIDCFGSELNTITAWDKLLFPVATDLPSAAATLQAVTAEIGKRKALYAEYPAAYDLQSYNRLAGAPIAPIVMLVDEGTAMLNEPGIADPLRQVVQTARQFGVYALLAGQNVNHRVMPTQTRDNFSTRLCFHTSAASRHVVLGETPNDVTVKGRAWMQRPGEMLQQVQCPFVTRDEVQRVITVGKPKRILDLEAIQPDTQGDDVARRIQALHADGISLNGIQREIFGYTGGQAYSAVKAALG